MEDSKRDNPQSDYPIRPTDNGIKAGDLISPQSSTLLELDVDGLPVGFADWEVFDGNC